MKRFVILWAAVLCLVFAGGAASARHGLKHPIGIPPVTSAKIVRGIPIRPCPPGVIRPGCHRVIGIVIRPCPLGVRRPWCRPRPPIGIVRPRPIGVRPIGVRPIGVRPIGVRPIGVAPHPIGVAPHPIGVPARAGARRKHAH